MDDELIGDPAAAALLARELRDTGYWWHLSYHQKTGTVECDGYTFDVPDRWKCTVTTSLEDQVDGDGPTMEDAMRAALASLDDQDVR